jgi:FMN phosphatase YigB (HAD superfamily)
VLSIGDNPLTDGKASHNYGFDFYLIRNELSEYMYHNENIPHHALGEYPSLQELLERQSTQQDA